jgi:hypothetical protein
MGKAASPTFNRRHFACLNAMYGAVHTGAAQNDILAF